MTDAAQLRLIAVTGLPLIQAGDDLAQLLVRQSSADGTPLRDGDVVVVAQKVVSKSEGRQIDLATVQPSARALEIAQLTEKDPRLVELVLCESRRIVRCGKDVLIVEHQLGFVMANAGIDQSNVAQGESAGYALLLPLDPDASARRLRAAIARLTGVTVGVIVSDSFGRPWRLGTVGVALGAAGVAALRDLRGAPDLFGRPLRVTLVGHADEIAAAASLLMGQGAEGRPMVIVRGLGSQAPELPVAALLRRPDEDLFR